MTLNTSNNDLMTRRREMVASLRLRGLTLREITATLAKQEPPMVNPRTGKAFDAATIKTDLDALKEEWRASANVHTDEHVARQVAEIAEIKRAAWGAKDPELALKALDKEMRLLGTMKQPGGVSITINLEVITRFEAIAKEAGIDPAQALEEYIQQIHALKSTVDTERGG